MFNSTQSECVGFDSTCQEVKTFEEESSQTTEIKYNHQKIQAGSTKSVEVQTDTVFRQLATLDDGEEKRLAAFLRNIEPQVVKELDRVTRSQGLFRDAENSYEGQQQLESILCHTLTPKLTSSEQIATCLSWSCTGSLVAVGIGFGEHVDWCKHESTVHLFNINMEETKQLVAVLNVTTCTTILSYHPKIPSLLVAGTYSGHLVQWDENGQPVYTDTKSAHDSKVTAVKWLTVDLGSKDDSQRLISCGEDGKIIIWQMETLNRPMVALFSLNPGCQHTIGQNHDAGPITCLDFEPNTNFLVFGTLCGCLPLYEVKEGGNELKELKGIKLQGHRDKILSVHIQQRSNQLITSCGLDREIHVYSTTQMAPLHVLHSSRTCLGSSWSALTNVLAWWGGGSEVEILEFRQGRNLKQRQLMQMTTLETQLEYGAGNTVVLCFNTTIPQLVATGDDKGCVRIWKIPMSRKINDPV